MKRLRVAACQRHTLSYFIADNANVDVDEEGTPREPCQCHRVQTAAIPARLSSLPRRTHTLDVGRSIWAARGPWSKWGVKARVSERLDERLGQQCRDSRVRLWGVF